MKVVINKCFGGFCLSKEAYEMLGLKWDKYGFEFCEREKRADPKLVEVVEKLGDKANGDGAKLRVVEIPDDVEWTIEKDDGNEWVSEEHRTWG